MMLRRVTQRPLSVIVQHSRSIASLPAAHVKDTPQEYFDFVAQKHNNGQLIAHRDVLHIIRKCKDSNDVHTAYKAMRLQHQCNIDYSEEMCCTFVNLALTAKKANWVMKLLLQPNNRLASWISRNALSNLINTLLEQNDIKGIVSALETVRSRGMSHVIDTKVVGKVLEVAERSEAKETMEPAIKALGTFLPK